VPLGPACQPTQLPGIVLPWPTYQLVQPPDTVAVGHQPAPWAPLFARHGAARARRPGAVAGCPELPATVPGPPLLPSPSSVWHDCADPPSFSFRHGATPSLSPSSGVKGTGRRPVPLFTLFPSHSSLSTATPYFCTASSHDRSRAPDIVPPRWIWSRHC
jgi:hypothetical protein